MKKILAGTTALIAIGTLAGAAQAADPIKLSVGGFMNRWLGIVDIDDETYNTYNNIGMVSDTEVQFSGSTVLDNGLKVAVNINLEAERIQNSTRNADQQYVTLSGGWGQVRLGEMKNAATLVHNSAPGAGGAFSDMSAILSQGVASGNTVTDLSSHVTSVDGINDAGVSSNAIDYISPMFGPFAFGVTYTPEVFSNGVAREGVSSKDLLGVAFVYADTWGPVSVNADIAYARFEELEAGTTVGAATAQNGMAHGMPIGLKLGYAGFEVGGSFFRIWDNAKVAAGAAPAAGTSYDGHAWDAGIAYTTGNWKFGYQYYASSLEGAITTHGKDKTGIHNGGMAYTMGPGVVVTANASHLSLKEETNNPRDKRASLGLITGLLLTF